MKQMTLSAEQIVTGITRVNNMTEVKKYQSLETLFDSLADEIADKVETDISSGTNTTALVVSGGTTPQPLFERLAATPLAWDKVTFVPSDERWLATNHDASNENLIRLSLLQDKAVTAAVQGLKLDFDTAQEAEAELNKVLKPVLGNYAVAVVGMGLDGHFASIFPGTPQEQNALDMSRDQLCYAVDATGCAVAGDYTERMTLSMSAILNAKHIYLLITGEEKLALVKKAINRDQSVSELPIVRLLQQSQTPVTVCCA